jgi:hypothetical protein
MNMRLLLVIVVSTFVISATVLLINYAKGYRPDLNNGRIKPTGLLVVASEPKGAQVWIDDELKTATDDTLNMDPGNYRVEIKKEGYIPWRKQLKVTKELVTQTEAVLFPITPNLQSLTSSGVLNPSLSPNGTKIVYVEGTGIWLMELTNLPLGFNQDPRQLVTGEIPNLKSEALNWADARFLWSPDSRELLAFFNKINGVEGTGPETDGTVDVIPTAVYLINTANEMAKTDNLINIRNRHQDVLLEWQIKKQELLNGQMTKLPKELGDLLATAAANLRFSPDETKLLYTATSSAQLKDNYFQPVPAASTQLEARGLSPGRTYVYDLKEDRNFLILDEKATATMSECEVYANSPWMHPLMENDFSKCPKLAWFPTSRHLVYFNEGKVSIMEYDSINNQVVYAGPIEKNYVFVHPSPSKLLLMTNLNPDAFPLPNIYSLSLR